MSAFRVESSQEPSDMDLGTQNFCSDNIPSFSTVLRQAYVAPEQS